MGTWNHLLCSGAVFVYGLPCKPKLQSVFVFQILMFWVWFLKICMKGAVIVQKKKNALRFLKYLPAVVLIVFIFVKRNWICCCGVSLYKAERCNRADTGQCKKSCNNSSFDVVCEFDWWCFHNFSSFRWFLICWLYYKTDIGTKPWQK